MAAHCACVFFIIQGLIYVQTLNITRAPDGVIVETSDFARQQSAVINYYLILETEFKQTNYLGNVFVLCRRICSRGVDDAWLCLLLLLLVYLF